MRADNEARKKARTEYAKALQAEKEASIKSINDALECLKRITTARPRQLIEGFQTNTGTSGQIINTYRLHGAYRRQVECLSNRLTRELYRLEIIPMEILGKVQILEGEEAK